jgi:aspartyl-tRNA(Asn)/glutamyl-tRNA(Gln) amidotransferase subunit A
MPPGPVFEESSSSVSLKGMKIGVPLAFSVLEANDKVRDTWLQTAQALESKGSTVEIVTEDVLSSHVVQRSLAAYYIIAVAEASSNLARYDGFRYGESAAQLELNTESTMTLLEQQYAATRTRGFGKEVVRRILCGTSVLSSDRFHTFYESAAKLRAVLTRQLHDTLEEFDMLLVPTAISEPPNIEQEMDPTEMFTNDVMTVPFSMAGLPAISFPRGRWSPSSPSIAGLQLVSARHSEAKLLSAAMALEANDS